MVKQVKGGDFWIDTELLGKIAEEAAHCIFLPEHVDAIEGDRAGVGVLQRGDDAHQGTLAGAVRAEQPEHVVADGE